MPHSGGALWRLGWLASGLLCSRLSALGFSLGFSVDLLEFGLISTFGWILASILIFDLILAGFRFDFDLNFEF